MSTNFETFLAMFCTRDYQDRCSSSITPKNKSSFIRSTSLSLIEKCKSSFCLFCFVLNKIKFDLFMLIESLLAWNQLDSTFKPAEESLCFLRGPLEWMIGPDNSRGGLATAFDLAAFRLSMIAPVKKSVNHPRTVASMRVTGWE